MEKWISKYALTKGIYKAKGHISSDKYFAEDDNYLFHGPKDWHDTQEQAIIAAKKKRDDRIKSLKKQIAVLEKLSF